jgi:hypothetical protein
MSYLPRHEDFGPLANPVHSKLDVPKKAGLLRRVFDALMASRQRQVDRQIALLVAARSGGRLTDELEREISQRVLSSGWSTNTGPFRGQRFP